MFIDENNIVEQEAIDQLALVFEDVGVGFAGHLIYAGDQGINWWTVVSLGRTMVRAPMSDGAERARRMARHRIRFHVLLLSKPPRLSALGILIPMWIIVTTAACLCADGPWRIRLTTAHAIMVGAINGYPEVWVAWPRTTIGRTQLR